MLLCFPRTQMWLRHDRLMIVLRPSATRHKFWLCTGFATGRPPEHPPGRPLRYRIQAMEMSADRKKNTQPAVLCVGADLLTSQTAFGGQLPYKGSLVRPVARFGHTYSCMMVGFYEPRTTSHEPLFFHEPRVTRGDVFNLSLLPQSGI